MDRSGELILEGTDLDLGIDETSRRFNRYHCVEASATLKPYLEWMTDIIKADPGSADISSMTKMVTFLFDRLMDPEESLRQVERVGLQYEPFKLKMEERKVEQYRQLYSLLVNTVREIESAVVTTTPHPPEVRPVSEPTMF